MIGRPLRALNDLPVRRKLTVIALLTSGVTLLLTFVGFMAYETIVFRRTTVRDHVSVARMLGENTASALTFSDPESAAQTLKSVAVHDQVVAVALYDRKGELFAVYRKAGEKHGDPLPDVQPGGHRWRSDAFELFEPIRDSGEVVGTLYIRSDLSEMWARILTSGAIILGVLSIATLLAYLLTRRLQGLVTAPIAQLARVAGAVTAERNYAVRAVKHGRDELGAFVDTFNAMLDQIQSRERALQEARDQLEHRVGERTRDLQRENAERREAEGRLANSLSVLNATLESTADGILVVDRDGRLVIFNRKFAVMWRIPEHVLAERDDARAVEFVAAQLKDPAAFASKIRDLRNHNGESSDVLEFTDGRVFERYSQVQRIDGEPVGRVWCFRDITERKRAEAELQNAHRQIVEASRQAGMAEVATGVLHNVGNVLNSVNVSATLLGDLVRQSKIARVAKLSELIAAQRGDLAGFFASDPRAQQIPGFLEALSTHLTREQGDVLRELEALRKNIEHIKDIVAMQQSYAKVSGVSETVGVTDLIEDALRMNSGAFARHDVKIVREFHVQPVVTTEKHRVLQILVNLMRNAKYACDDSGRTDKRITLRVSNDAGRVKIAVIDNGVGIPPENLTRIFAHGFTTRKHGHGFGLHSGAIAAKELGGALIAESEGTGRGATFTLELPLMAEAKAA